MMATAEAARQAAAAAASAAVDAQDIATEIGRALAEPPAKSPLRARMLTAQVRNNMERKWGRRDRRPMWKQKAVVQRAAVRAIIGAWKRHRAVRGCASPQQRVDAARRAAASE